MLKASSLSNGTLLVPNEPTHLRGFELRTTEQPPDLLNDDVGHRMQNARHLSSTKRSRVMFLRSALTHSTLLAETSTYLRVLFRYWDTVLLSEYQTIRVYHGIALLECKR